MTADMDDPPHSRSEGVVRSHYPVWRSIGIFLGFMNAILIIQAAQLYVSPNSTNTISIGWFSRTSVPYDEAYQSLIFCLGMGVIGAISSLKWPWQGFVLLGAGYLFSAISLVVLFRWTEQHLAGASMYLAAGLWFSRLGIKERGQAEDTGRTDHGP